MMSLIDGISLSVSQSLMIDVGLEKLLARANQRQTGLQFARVVTILSGIFAAWGVRFVLNFLGSSIFDFVYILIVAQLSLLGPVLVGLLFKSRRVQHMWLGIAVGLIFGVSTNIIGGVFGVNWLMDASGTIAALTSTMASVGLFIIAGGTSHKQSI